LQSVTHRILLTGGPGFGKSSIIEELERMEYAVFHEIAREIIRHEIEINGTALPWIDVHAFSEQVIQGRIRQHAEGYSKTSFYDRGLPDIAGFLLKDKKSIPEELMQLCVSHSYNKRIFITPPWEAIFHRDEQRSEDFAAAIRVHKALEYLYTDLGYELIPVPMGSVKWRAEFILKELGMM